MNRNLYDFDAVIDRRNTHATKFEDMDARFGRADLLPFWIADMDFPASPFIIDALRQRLDHAVLGYTSTPANFWQCIASWIERHYMWKPSAEHITFMPGMKKGIGLCINYFSKPGDGIVIQPPVYHSFRTVIEGNGRRVVENALVETSDGSYTMDLRGLERILECEKPAMMIVCNPHNPIGLQWDSDTLSQVASLCARHGVVLLSDEIYADLMLGGRTHIATASVSEEARQVTVTLGAPSKSFNIPGIVSAWCVIENDDLRNPFFAWLTANEFNTPPIDSMVATRAAYEHGAPWLQNIVAYLDSNVERVAAFIRSQVPQVRMHKPDATFAVWLDFRSLGLTQEQLVKLLIHSGRIALSDGTTFGACGEGFMRMNVAVPRSVLDEGLQRLKEAVQSQVGQPLSEPVKCSLPFVKMHGLGNDFVLIDCMDRALSDFENLAMQMCTRRKGVGADGLIVVCRSERGADCCMRIFNADGSEAQMCGNGIRCVAKYVYDYNIARREHLEIDTMSGIRSVRVFTGLDGKVQSVTVDMGVPEFAPEHIPVMHGGKEMIDALVTLGDRCINLSAVSMGNPHGVVFVETINDEMVHRLGPRLENHMMWPQRANIEFVRCIDYATLEMRAWERGAGETMACGTGACAAAVVAVRTGQASWPVAVRLTGGELVIDMDMATGHVLMTGPATTVYSGEFFQR